MVNENELTWEEIERHNLDEPDYAKDERWIAWAAGFIDGEGAIMIYRSKPAYRKPKGQLQLAVHIGQSALAPIDRLCEMFGGAVDEKKAGTGSYKRSHFTLRMHGEKAASMLRKIRPYLLVKGQHADIAIQFQEALEAGVPFEGRIQYYDAMRALQQKGLHRRND